jgi:hypothetical protein
MPRGNPCKGLQLSHLRQLPKDMPMQNLTPLTCEPAPPRTSPWSLRAWPPVLWQAQRAAGLRLRHLGTRVTAPAMPFGSAAGQTLWAASSDDGQAGLAWDWVQIREGVVAMVDPMTVVTNLRIIGDEGEVLTAAEAALYLNEIVHGLPWQHEVARAIATPTQ